MVLMIVIVLAAFRDSGGLNAGTPFATASVPVSADDPLANARMTRRMLRPSRGTGYGVTPVTCGGSSRSDGPWPARQEEI